MVFFALVTACRLAGAPTRISPLSVYATTEGVVRAPSLFSMTLGLPPSITATQELVVPRSMPMIFAMIVALVSVFLNCVENWVDGLWLQEPGLNHPGRCLVPPPNAGRSAPALST